MKRDELALALMMDFARYTGLLGNSDSRRYLWTDAFAVCNFLGIYRQTGDREFLDLAVGLVNQVHHILGRHRNDDPRRGWISGLSEHEGELRPTCGGLRIGKPINERPPDQPIDQRSEWDRDGQYYHYLTKWLHALHCTERQTGDARYHRWAVELAVVAQRSFTRCSFPGFPKQMVWKMSIDLSRPLVSSMGQHDPLDGLVTCLELQTDHDVSLDQAINELTPMCAHGDWGTDDPLGVGGLLDAASRLAQLVFNRGVEYRGLLRQILVDVETSLYDIAESSFLSNPAERRLAFRELGLSIGFQGLERINGIVSSDREISSLVASTAAVSH